MSSLFSHRFAAPSDWEIAFSSIVFATALLALLRSASRARRGSLPHYERIARQEGGWLLSKAFMRLGYDAIQPLGEALVQRRVRPNTITWASGSLVLASAAAIAWGANLAGATLLLLSALGDALDGLVARRLRATSRAGAFLDAFWDRVGEFAVLLGIAVGGPQGVAFLTLVVLAIAGNFLNSYVSAKAEAADVAVPSGKMRRGERSVWLMGAVLAPSLLAPVAGSAQWLPLAAHTVLLGWLAAASSASAIARATGLSARLRELDAPSHPGRRHPIPCSASEEQQGASGSELAPATAPPAEVFPAEAKKAPLDHTPLSSPRKTPLLNTRE